MCLHRRFSSALAHLCLALLCVIGKAASHTEPVGCIIENLAVGTTGIAFPLLTERGRANVVSQNASALTISTPIPAASLVAGRAYYAEVLSGASEGERFDLAATTPVSGEGQVLNLNLDPTSNSTRTSIGNLTLTGAVVAIREHLTLATLQTQFRPGLVGNNTVTLADSVQLHRPATGWVTYYLRGDGQTWRAVGKVSDERSRIIPPDTSITIVLRSAPHRWQHIGSVRTNAFRRNLVAGTQSFACGFPLAMSPADLAAHVDPLAPDDWRWTGGGTPDQADRLYPIGPTGAVTEYWLTNNGSTWLTNTTSGDQSNNRILSASGAAVVTRLKPDPAFIVARPFPL